jgi:hypothetical protein
MYNDNNVIDIKTEDDLHRSVVRFLRKQYPDVLFNATLGENQQSEQLRITSKAKGYQKGIPDLFVYECNKDYHGIAIEFKSPLGTGVLSNHQENCLEKLEDGGWKVILSNDYNHIIVEIMNYMNERAILSATIQCQQCNKSFKKQKTFLTHVQKYHNA